MIQRVVIENFKSLKRVDLTLGSLNVLIGANASGKSNFFEALRVLQGVGYGFTLSEILDGKPKGASSEVWEGIRGGSAHVLFERAEPEGLVSFRVECGAKRPMMLKQNGSREPMFGNLVNEWAYQIAFDAKAGALRREELTSDKEGIIFSSERIENPSSAAVFNVEVPTGKPGRAPQYPFGRHQPVLGQLGTGLNKLSAPGRDNVVKAVSAALSDMQRLDPAPSVLRGYSTARRIDRMGERGENFAALVATICSDPAAKEALLSWLRELRPRELDDLGTLSGAVGEPLFMLSESGRQLPAPVLSDGTLRFAAIAAAFFQPSMPRLITIEEIENGIHASRLRLMVELLRSRSRTNGTQIIVTTHSPLVLAWLKPEEYHTTFFCRRDDETGESVILPVTKIPQFNEVIRKQPISDLFAEGWLEAAL